MNENSYLNPTTLTQQCETAISKLNRDNDAIHVVEGSLSDFVGDSEIKSEAFDALKVQITDYKTVLQAMRSSNDADIADFNTLKGKVGDEVLDGSTILSQKKSAADAKESDENSAQEYDGKADDTIFPWMNLYYSYKASDYRNMAEIDQNLYDKWKAKEEKYDQIESETSGLFASSTDTRAVAKSALASITGAFKDGSYSPDMNADWRKALEKCYFDRIVKVGEDGSVSPNWPEVEKIMQKDADDITDEEYRTLAFLYLNVNNDDMAKFIGCCMHKEDVDVPWYNELFGPSAGQASEDYSKWTVDKDKVNKLMSQISNTSDQTLLLIQNIDSNKYPDAYKLLKKQRNQIIQRQTLLNVVQETGEFHGDYKAGAPSISIESGADDSLVLNFKEYKNIGSSASPTFSNLGKSTINVSATSNGVNSMSTAIESSEADFYGHFGDVNELKETATFTYGQVKDELIDKGSDKLASYVVEKTEREALGKAVGYIPLAGDVIGFGVDLAQKEQEAKENNTFIKGQFDSLKAANVYSDFDCSTSFVKYDTSKKKKLSVYAYDGEDTGEIVDRVNKKLNSDFNVQDVVNNPNDVYKKKEEIFSADHDNEDLYDDAVRGN